VKTLEKRLKWFIEALGILGRLLNEPTRFCAVHCNLIYEGKSNNMKGGKQKLLNLTSYVQKDHGL